MRILISAGSSGGHIYPALSLIKVIKEKNPTAQILFVGREKGMEYQATKNLDLDFFAIESYSFQRKKIFKNFRLIITFIKNYFVMRTQLKKFKPDAVIGFGGHVTISVIFTSRKMGIKTYIHEQNKIVGKANRFLSNYVNAVFLSYEETIGLKKNVKTIFTGNPTASDAIKFKSCKKTDLGLDDNKKLVLIAMGSQGSLTVHNHLIANLNKLDFKNYQVVYITGTRNFKEEYKTKFNNNVIILPFFEGLAGLMKVADLVVSRAGATTICEIIALQKPAILIPSPYVPDNHQYYNAKDLVDKKGAIMLLEDDLEKLFDQIDKVIKDDQKRSELSKTLSEIKIDNGGQLIYNVLN